MVSFLHVVSVGGVYPFYHILRNEFYSRILVVVQVVCVQIIIEVNVWSFELD